MKIVIGSDHTAFELKKYLKDNLTGHQIIDINSTKQDKVNYALVGFDLGEYVKAKKADLGIALCGTGIGMSIATNKVKTIICALCNDVLSARFAKTHNNANMIAIGARLVAKEKALVIVQEFLNNKFEGNRHKQRIETILKYEDNN